MNIWGGITLGERLAETNNRPSGFDYLRIGLAVAVAVWHVLQLTYGAAAEATLPHYRVFWHLTRAILPMFFALSGFLVAGSLERCRTIGAFIGLRMIRIFPALAVEVTLSALVLGPLLTSFSHKAYFLDPDFRRYFLNTIGEIHFVLPGLFLNAPAGNVVNNQLWTIPFELMCYLSLVALVFFGVRKWRLVALALTGVAMTLFFCRAGMLHHWNRADFVLGGIGLRHGIYLVWSFLWGVILYLYRDKVRWNLLSLIVAVAVSAIAVKLDGMANIILPISFAFATVIIGLTNFPRIWLLKGADYSYGIYLYHWIIFQTVVQFAPHHWYWTLGIGLPLIVVFAAFSWHVIEKPAMQMRLPLMRDDKLGGGRALIASATFATFLVGFVLSYQLYPMLNPTGAVGPTSDTQRAE